MTDHLLATKVSMPLLRRVLVPRTRILTLLSEGVRDGHVLTLASAPAGYGKTTTIRMWVEQAGYPVAWVTLEHTDNDLRQFLTYVLTALHQAGDDLGQAALDVVERAQEIELQHVLALLINDLHKLKQPIILVLEEYHLIENEQIDRSLELLLNQAVANLHLVIATREDPNLPLTRLRVRNQLTEIRAADLSFSIEEAGEFFSKVMGVHLSTRDLAILQDRTEGWAAGLQLAALSLKQSGDPSRFVEAFRGTHRHVLDYLIEEVLNSQPEGLRQFLRRTAILDQLCSSLCEAVTGQKDSQRYLNALEHNNLFLIALDQERTWYRYHALFAELLKSQLAHTEPDRLDDLHERAADWYEHHGFVQKAVEHAFQSSNSAKLVGLIETHAMPMLYQGNVSIVEGWFGRLPESLMQASPMMCIAKAWSLALMQRQAPRTDDVVQALQAADDALNRANAPVVLRNLVAGHTASIRVFTIEAPVLLYEHPEQLVEIAQQAQQLLPEAETAIRSVNAMIIGNGYARLGDVPAAERAYTQTFEDGVAGRNYYAAIYGPINLVLSAMIKGQLKDALRLCEATIDRFDRLLAGLSFPPIGALYTLKGCILLEENRLVEAEQELTQGLSLLQWTGEFRAHMKGYAALARLHAIQGNWTAMAENLRLLEATRPEGVLYAQALRRHLAVHDPAANKTSLEEARLWVSHAPIRFSELPDITGVDPITETHLRTYLSTAHILARLAARNPQAYVLADVHGYLARQEIVAEAHELAGRLIEIWLVRALMYRVEGRAEEARRMLQSALSAAARRGYFRIFLDEADLLRPLLEAVEPRLNDDELSAYARRLIEAMPRESVKDATSLVDADQLSDRELDVLRHLAAGQSYKEIGQRLFLSLNTVQFHIKNIYRKLAVNTRMQAIDKARALTLI